MLYLQYVHLTKAKPIHKRHPILLSEMLHKDYNRKDPVEKKISSLEHQGADAKTTDWRQTASRKVTLTLADQQSLGRRGPAAIYCTIVHSRRRESHRKQMHVVSPSLLE
jgi:hypothetical protein